MNNETKSCCSGNAQSEGCCCGCSSNGKIKNSTKLLWAGISLIASFCISHFEWNFVGFPYTDPAWIAVFLCAGPIFKAAFSAFIKDGSIITPMLVSMAMIASFILQIMAMCGIDVGGHHQSYIFVVGEIAFLMTLGEWLENRTTSRTRNNFKKLATLLPKTARVRRDKGIIEIPSNEIQVGDIICVKPHEMISADGKIIIGQTSVNQANITGESMPIDKSVGDNVLCGTFNETEYIEIQATKAGSDFILVKMIELADEAEGKRAPISRAANKWATFVVPSALVLSLITFIVARFILDTSFIEAVVRATTILVVFCPCAFVLATPTAISAGLGNAAKKGILIKSGAILENFAKTTSIFFDKTGTLTSGEIKVEDYECFYDDKNFLFASIATIENNSNHPIAKSLKDFATSQTQMQLNAEKIEVKMGIGISGIVENKQIEIKKASTDNNKTTSEVFIDNVLAAKFYFSDTVRSSAITAIKELQEMGIATMILSGDNQKAVEEVAEKVSIKNFKSNLLPQDKLNAINKAQSEGEVVCMVGDGINDTPSFAAADMSIAIANAQNDIAINTAQISIIDGDLRKIANLTDLSKTVMATITTNIIFSLTLSLTAVVLGTLGIISPAIGAIIHNISSVSVVANSARLLGKK